MARTKKPDPVNVHGLTHGKWIAAAGPVPMLDFPKLKKAWEAGDSPEDWRAYYADMDRKAKLERLAQRKADEDAELEAILARIRARGEHPIP
jgi:hypothetical protein